MRKHKTQMQELLGYYLGPVGGKLVSAAAAAAAAKSVVVVFAHCTRSCCVCPLSRSWRVSYKLIGWLVDSLIIASGLVAALLGVSY
jgi:hypothetical protein